MAETAREIAERVASEFLDDYEVITPPFVSKSLAKAIERALLSYAAEPIQK